MIRILLASAFALVAFNAHAVDTVKDPDGRDVLENGCPPAMPFINRGACCEKPLILSDPAPQTGQCTYHSGLFPIRPWEPESPLPNSDAEDKRVNCGNGSIGYPAGVVFGSVLFGNSMTDLKAADCCSKRADIVGVKGPAVGGMGKSGRLAMCQPTSRWQKSWDRADQIEKKQAEDLLAKKKAELEVLIKLIEELKKKGVV